MGEHKPSNIASGDEIDAVISWVDGADPVHLEKRRGAMKDIKLHQLHYLPSGLEEHRFRDNNELRYCVHSIRKFIPWIRTIHVVTDNQRPEFISSQEISDLRINFVDHQSLFKGHTQVLPTFNSRTIETAIFRTPGLAERYIYFNDDFVVLRLTSPLEFFEGRKIVLRGNRQPLKNYGPARIIASGILNRLYKTLKLRERAMATLPQYKAAQLAGLSGRYIKAPHVPYPINTDTLRRYFAKHPEVFSQNIKYKFRSMHQFVTHPLAASLEIKKGNYILKEEQDFIMLNFAKKDTIETEVAALTTGNYRFACLQGLEYADRTLRDEVIQFLEHRIFDQQINSER